MPAILETTAEVLGGVQKTLEQDERKEEAAFAPLRR
jgi:hypothetical protein